MKWCDYMSHSFVRNFEKNCLFICSHSAAATWKTYIILISYSND